MIARRFERVVARMASFLGIDGLFVAVVLAITYGSFLRTWQIWEDQAIYHYMAWSVRHGGVLYRDVINMNWPGTIFVHVVAQWMTGMDPQGVRIMECLFLGVLGITTSAILREYGVPTPLRLAAFTLFLIAYFSAGDPATAQRETWMTPCLAAGLFPLFTANGQRTDIPYSRWIFGGAMAAFGLLVKPTLGPPIAAALFTTIAFWDGRTYGPLWKRLGAYAASGLAVLLLTIVLLAIYGDLRGFWFWAVELTFGPYAHLRRPSATMIRAITTVVGSETFAKMRWMVGLGICAFVAVILTFLASAPWATKENWAQWRTVARRIVNHVLLVWLCAWTVYVQGKATGDYSHFIPLKWALAVFGAVLCGLPFSLLPSRWFRASERTRHAISVLAFIALGTYWSTFAGDRCRNQPGDGMKVAAKVAVAKALGPDETAIVFGFSSPSFYCVAQRQSPLPFVDSWIMYATSPDGSKFRNEYIRIWEEAMRSPHLRLFVVQHENQLEADLRFPDGKPALSQDEVSRLFPPSKLAELGFAPSRAMVFPGMDIYERDTHSASHQTAK
jgi:hypothetical protein